MPSHNPFAPVAYRERSAKSEYPADAPPMMQRLIRLGITSTEREQVREAWAAMTEAERAESATMYENVDDDELLRAIEEARADEAEEAGAAPAEHISGADAEAAAVDPEDVPDGPVPVVLEWVDDNPHRAAAALVAEQRRHDPPRKTLVEPLEALLG